MKCADSAEMARSASAKVRCLGGWPVMRCLFWGSRNASASGCRARTRRNNPSSVGDALFWITGSFRSRFRLLPPGLGEISRQGGGTWPFYPIPARDPLLSCIKQRDSVEARHQGPVERTHRRNEGGMLARLQHRRDQVVDGGVVGAHIVSRAQGICSSASPIEELLVAGRQRLIPAILDHVEIEAEPALIELNGVDRAHRGLD